MIAAAPPIGAVLARRYRVESVLGQGGMGLVLGVRDEKTGVACALKVLSSPAARSDAERMMREARALMLISSPHVVRIFDVGELPEIGPYLVLERLAGSTLAQLAPLGRALPYPLVARYAVEVCDALAHAHALGIVHRDVKLSNVFVARTVENRQIVKVLDFGISKLTHAAGEGLHTLTSDSGGALGSPQFISPEQLVDPHGVDARTDLWALGVVLFRLLTGRFPFEGSTVAEIFGGVLHREPPTLAACGVEVPAPLQGVLERCMCKAREGRFASAADLGAALRPFADFEAGVEALPPKSGAPELVGAEEASTVPRPLPASPRRAPRGAWIAVGALGAVLVGAGAIGASARAESAPVALVVPAPVTPPAPTADPLRASTVPSTSTDDAPPAAPAPVRRADVDARRSAIRIAPEGTPHAKRAGAAPGARAANGATAASAAPAPEPAAGALKRNPYL